MADVVASPPPSLLTEETAHSSEEAAHWSNLNIDSGLNQSGYSKRETLSLSCDIPFNFTLWVIVKQVAT